MTQNTTFQTLVPSFCFNFPFFYPINFQNVDNFQECQIENFRNDNFTQNWTNKFNYEKNMEELQSKLDDNHIIDQPSTGLKSYQLFQKPKRTQAPRFRPTKNNESNISNQTFSFVTNQNKSQNTLQIFFKNKRKTQHFYEYSKFLIPKRKKYMSKGTLLRLSTLTQFLEEFQGLKKIKLSTILTLKQFESGVRFLILYFLKHMSVSSILTSQKIAGNLKKDHINKVRQIANYIEENLNVGAQEPRQNEDTLQVKLEY